MNLPEQSWMRLALEEARLGEGGTRPNPPVGAVIVRDGRVLARGHHSRAGGLHAETDALSRLPPGGAQGATMYVTLEPCSTAGRVGPCTEAILAAGITRVVVATIDRNPRHQGRGLDALRGRGVAVELLPDTAPERQAAEAILAPFFKHNRTGLPYVTLKMAQTLDGAIADHAGVSRWITSPEARAEVDRMRQRADVVLVGSGTALADDPSLLRKTERPGYAGLPGLRCILDARGRVPATAQVLTDGHAEQTILATSPLCPMEVRAAWTAAGAQVWEVPLRFPAGTQGAVQPPELDLEALLHAFGRADILHVLCEGGAALATSLIAQGLIDELALFVAPKIFGDGARRTFGGQPFDLPTAPRFHLLATQTFGPDLLLRYRPEPLSSC